MSQWTVQVKADYDEHYQKMRLYFEDEAICYPAPIGRPAIAAHISFSNRFDWFSGWRNIERCEVFQNLMLERYPELTRARLRHLNNIPF